MASYRVVRDEVEKMVDELIIKYKKAKLEYEILKDEEMKGTRALKDFDKHVRVIEREKQSGSLTEERVEEVLEDLKEDTMQMNRITIKVAYTVPPDTSFA